VNPTAARARVISESLAYTAIDAAQNVLALAVVPASLFWLTPADMGVVTLALVVTQFAMTGAAVGLDFSVVRFFLQWPADDRSRRAVGVLLVVTCAAILMTGGTLIVNQAFGLVETVPLAAAVAAGAGLAVRSIPLAVFRVTSDLRRYGSTVIAASALQATLQIAALLLGYHVNGFLVAAAIASWLPTIWAAWHLGHHSQGVIWPDMATWRLAGWSLAGGLANRSTANVDRLALWLWTTVDAIGVYGTASRWSLPLRMVSGGTKLAIAPALSRAEDDGEASATAAADAVSTFVSLLALLSVLLLASSALMVLTPWRDVLPQFQRLLALLLAAQLLSCLTLIAQVLLYYADQSARSATVAFVSAITVVAGLFWLVPSYGATGAATAQCGASLVTLAAFRVLAGRAERAAINAIRPLLLLSAALASPWLLGPIATGVFATAVAAVLARSAWGAWRGLRMAA
jgi:O-antigen/teichoic acid export membrane protein